MSDRITASPLPSTIALPGATPDVRQRGAARPQPAGETHEGPSFADVLRQAAESMAEGQTRIDRAVRRGARGETDPGRLLALQAGVYRYTQELELASKLVDKATSAVKTTLQSQQ